jgi:hypothetical protein
MFLLFTWFEGIVFCGIYTNTGDMWIYGSVTSVVLGIVGVQLVIIPAFFVIMRIILNLNRKRR